MSIDKETLEYDNNRGAITGTVEATFNFNDNVKYIKIFFDNTNRHKRNDLRVTYAKLGEQDLYSLTDNDDWANYEAEIFEAIEELENADSDDVSDYVGEGYVGAIK